MKSPPQVRWFGNLMRQPHGMVVGPPFLKQVATHAKNNKHGLCPVTRTNMLVIVLATVPGMLPLALNWTFNLWFYIKMTKKKLYEIYSQRGTKHVMSFFLEHVASKSSFKNTVGRASPILKVGWNIETPSSLLFTRK